MTSTWVVENYVTEEEFELLHMTFVIEDGVPTCIVEVKEEIDGRTPEDTAEQLRMMLNRQFPVPPAPMPRQNGPPTVPQGLPLRRSTRRRKPRVCRTTARRTAPQPNGPFKGQPILSKRYNKADYKQFLNEQRAAGKRANSF